MIVSILYKVIRNRSSDVRRLDATLGLFVKNLKGVKVQDVSHLNYSLNLKNKLSCRVEFSLRGWDPLEHTFIIRISLAFWLFI